MHGKGIFAACAASVMTTVLAQNSDFPILPPFANTSSIASTTQESSSTFSLLPTLTSSESSSTASSSSSSSTSSTMSSSTSIVLPTTGGAAPPSAPSTSSAPTATPSAVIPVLVCNVNFNDGSFYDNDGNTNGVEQQRFTQANAINAALPNNIQTAFNNDAINFYDSGNGDFYYVKNFDTADECTVSQVSRACNCYVGQDGQIRFLSFTPGQTTEPVAPAVQAAPGDNLFDIAQRFGFTVQDLLDVNPDITNPDLILVGQTINLPTQNFPTYRVVAGDSLSRIAGLFGTTTDTLIGLNTQLQDSNLIFIGQLIRLPEGTTGNGVINAGSSPADSAPVPRVLVDGDTLFDISQELGITFGELLSINPQIADPNQINAGDSIFVPGTAPQTQGTLTFTETAQPARKRSAKYARSYNSKL